ncbi:MAG: DUF3786 domain-containing protein [Candidatus Ratteibacteria bacterium]
MSKGYKDLIDKCFEDLKKIILIKGGKIEVLYFNKIVKIDFILKKFEGVDDEKEKVILLHYLRNFKDKKNNELITFKSLPDGNFYFPSIYSRVYLPLIKKYGKNPERFIEKSLEIGGEKISDFSIKFNVFPNVFFIFELIPEDEEFPADLRILFNRVSSEIFEIEDLAIIGEIIVSKIT